MGGVKNAELQKIKSLQKRAIRAVNNSSFKAHSDPIFFRLELLNFVDTYKLGVLSFMHKYFYENLPASADHDILLNKLKHHGFRGTTIINGLKSF